ncbi:hypothetical protein LY78DRAFT_642002 [Colletotrichum sublineola]|nr:hypothetical protein LY78DRAFT_642002 [Colletotrichum sublineola]
MSDDENRLSLSASSTSKAVPHSFWDTSEVPPADSRAFVDFIYRHPIDSHVELANFHPKQDEISTWSGAPNEESHASFGDDGVTASVNAYGDLIQFSSYLGAGRSGMFSADQRNTSEPYMVSSRAEELLELRRDWRRENISYGLQIPGINLESCHHSGYVHDRWPRYEFGGEDLKATTQWMVRNKTVLQQCLVTNTGTEELTVPCHFGRGLHIRDLDYLDSSYGFNENWTDQISTRGPNGYGWILVHPLPNEEVSKEAPEGNTTSVVSASAAGSVRRLSSRPATGDIENKPPDLPSDARDSQTQTGEADAIAVVVSVFVNGKAIQWRATDLDNTDIILLEEPLKGGGTLEVVTAYKMVHLSKSRAGWKEFLLWPAVTDVSNHLASEPFTPFHPSEHVDHVECTDATHSEGLVSQLMGSSSLAVRRRPENLPTDSSINHIDFVVRRNLEHILSVCAVPVEGSLLGGETLRVALTCGDMSGHRVCSSASFFAFSFLLEIARQIDALPEESLRQPYKTLRQRIDAVCRGHLQWISQVNKTKSNCFAANYWVTGNIMTFETASYMPNESLTDTPFQLMKACDFADQYTSRTDQDLAQGIVHSVAKDWITALDKTDKRLSHVWPHAQDEGCNKYRLNEHVWVWRVLKFIEDNRSKFPQPNQLPDVRNPREDKTPMENERNQLEKTKVNDEQLFRKFNSREIQRDILRRFTAENDVSKKRMLAMTRSARETRFLFHASDTALFYGIKWDFFLRETSFKEVWENTIEAQVQHTENSETGWDNSLRYALAIMIGAIDKSINKRLPHDLITSSFKVLLRTTGPNGLFYGQLDGATKEPTLFTREMDRDFYFHASFEIPYILLTHRKEIGSALRNTSEKHPELSPRLNPTEITPQNPVEQVVEMMTTHPKRQSLVIDHRSPSLQVPTTEFVEVQTPSAGLQVGITSKKPKTLVMKKSMPFNSLIDQSSIVDLEEEWLYNYPSFFMADEKTSENLIEEIKQLSNQTESDTSGAVITKAAKSYMEKFAGLQSDGEQHPDPLRALHGPYSPSSVNQSWVVDILKRKHLSKQQRADGVRIQLIPEDPDLWRLLTGPRTAIKAKKRFIWLPGANDERALICLLASPAEEKPAISLFFDRHSHYEKQFIEETMVILNTWESELHLSFYQLVHESCRPSPGIPEPSVDILPGNAKKKLVRASTGFRFFGDFFDRHWTCHFIEYVPGRKANPHVLWSDERSDIDFPLGKKGDLVQEQGCWRQRRVLELHLFDRILKEVVRSTKEILDEVKNELGVKHGAISFSVLNSDDYFTSSAQWQKFQQILQVVEEELSDVLLAVSKWETREKDRGQERPRWTRNDERKYRLFIGKLEGTTRRRIRDLQNYHGNIRSLKDTLISSQQQIRDDLGLRGAENIRFFTYVTVVFLPLGFAASIFSMSEAPPNGVLAPMIVCSVVALVLTVVALANAKRLNAIVEGVSMVINSYSREKMSSSLLVQGHERRKRARRESRIRRAEEAKVQGKSGKHLTRGAPRASRRIKAHEGEISWHFWFWLTYVFIELPARRVLVAYGHLRDPKVTRWTTYVHVIVGVILLPVFIVTYFFQLLLYNLNDLAHFIWEHVKDYVASYGSNEDQNLDDHLGWLTYPMDKYRPLKKPEEPGADRTSPEQNETELPKDRGGSSSSDET